MADDTRVSGFRTLRVQYEPIESPVYGCDHIIARRINDDDSFILQMFSTTPPVIGDGGESVLIEPLRRCMGQFHLTPKLAQRLVTMIQDQMKVPSDRE